MESEWLFYQGAAIVSLDMFIYGKMAAKAIAVLSYLAEDPARRAGSAEIAKARGLSQALAAKLLTQMAMVQWVEGQPGPGGGYRLRRPAETIRLLDVVDLFEQSGEPSICPFGPNWCGHNEPCPLHDQLVNLMRENRLFLEKTTMAVFVQNNVPRKPVRKS